MAGSDRDQTALHYASKFGHKAIATMLVEKMVEKGVDLGLKNNYGKTALDLATQKGHTAIVDLLKQMGAVTDAELLEAK